MERSVLRQRMVLPEKASAPTLDGTPSPPSAGSSIGMFSTGLRIARWYHSLCHGQYQTSRSW
eukprot:2610890-Rhodomonas_salina.3